MQKLYWAAALACIAYYIIIGFTARFGLSQSWMWLAFAGVFLAAGFACGLNLPQWVRVIWRTGLCIALTATVALMGLVSTGMRQAQPAGLDYLIVLGAHVEADGPSPALRRRINAALDYLEENPETIIIASGGQGHDEPTTEAKCIRDELVKAGVPESQILMEDQSTSTAENMVFSKELIPEGASVGFVTNNFHVYRALLLAKKTGYTDVHGIATDYRGFTLLHYMVREAVCLVVGAIG